MGDLLGADFSLGHKDKLYRCLDKLLLHKTELFSSAAALEEFVWGGLRSPALRSDQHLFRMRPTGGRQAALWLQPGQAVGLRPGGDRADRDAGRLAAGLRGDGGKHLGQDDVARLHLRSNVTEGDPAQLWTFYLQLVEVEQAFKELKDDLAIRPIYHQTDARIEAHIFVAFLAYCLQVTLKQRLRSLAPGLTPGSRRKRWRRSKWSMRICRPPTAVPSFCRATPNRRRIRPSCSNG